MSRLLRCPSRFVSLLLSRFCCVQLQQISVVLTPRMAANPDLSSVSQPGQATHVPALYEHEVIALQRDGIDFSINGLRHQSGK